MHDIQLLKPSTSQHTSQISFSLTYIYVYLIYMYCTIHWSKPRANMVDLPPIRQSSLLKYQIASLLRICFWISSSHHGDELRVVYSSILYYIVIVQLIYDFRNVIINHELMTLVRTLSLSASEMISLISWPLYKPFSFSACSSSSLVMYL